MGPNWSKRLHDLFWELTLNVFLRFRGKMGYLKNKSNIDNCLYKCPTLPWVGHFLSLFGSKTWNIFFVKSDSRLFSKFCKMVGHYNWVKMGGNTDFSCKQIYGLKCGKFTLSLAQNLHLEFAFDFICFWIFISDLAEIFLCQCRSKGWYTLTVLKK